MARLLHRLALMLNKTRRAVIVCVLTGFATAAAAQPQRTHTPLFPPEDLGLLEGPDRDAWQKPDDVMDALRIADGDSVADVGAGAGYFTVRLARRVGRTGMVYSEDVQPQMIESIRNRVVREGLTNVQTVIGVADDPMLPNDIDAILMVEVFTQLANPVTFLRNTGASLKPTGLLGVVEYKRDGFGPGPPMEERATQDEVRRAGERAGLAVVSIDDTLLRYQFLITFARSQD